VGLETVALDHDAQSRVGEIDPAHPLTAVPDGHLCPEAGQVCLEQDGARAGLEGVRGAGVQLS